MTNLNDLMVDANLSNVNIYANNEKIEIPIQPAGFRGIVRYQFGSLQRGQTVDRTLIRRVACEGVGKSCH